MYPVGGVPGKKTIVMFKNDLKGGGGMIYDLLTSFFSIDCILIFIAFP